MISIETPRVISSYASQDGQLSARRLSMPLPDRSPLLGQPGRCEGFLLAESVNPPVRGQWRYLVLTQSIGHTGESGSNHRHNRAPSDTYVYGPHKSNWVHSTSYK